MSEPTVGEVLEMLARYAEAVDKCMLGQGSAEEMTLALEMDAANIALEQLDPAHIRTLATALTPPAPASAQVVVNRADVREVLDFAGHNCDPEQFHDSCLYCGKATAWETAHAPDCLIPRLTAALKSEKAKG